MIELNYVAKKISNARKEKGFTQEELAARLGISSKAISKWERALSLPDIDLIIDLSKILDMSLESLLVTDTDEKDNTRSNLFDIKKFDPSQQIINDQTIMVIFGTKLVPFWKDSYITNFSNIRKDIFADTGVLIPSLRIMDVEDLPKYECILKVFGKVIWEKNYSETEKDIFADVILNIKQIIEGILPEFVNRHMVKILMEGVENCLPFVVQGVIPERISLSTLRNILKMLITNKKSIRNLVGIIGEIDGLIDTISDVEILKQTILEARSKEID